MNAPINLALYRYLVAHGASESEAEAAARLDPARVAGNRRHRARRIADHALVRERREQLAHGRTRHVTWYLPTRSA